MQQQPPAALQPTPLSCIARAPALNQHFPVCSAASQFQGACFKDDRTLLVTEYMEVRNVWCSS